MDASLFARGMALHFVLWLAYVLSIDPQDLGVGVAVAALAQAFVLAAIPKREGARLRGLGYRSVRLLPSPLAFLRGAATVTAAAFDAARVEPAEGRLVEASAPATPGEQALAAIGLSITPESIVIDIEGARGRFLVHELVAAEAAT
jgi:multisubunit Na+/H+ antiporter MnhE subunit